MILTFLRTVILYLVLIAGVRFLGKRQIGQLEPSEFVVTLLIADLASVPMQDGGIPMLSGVVPILTLLGLELTFSGLIMRSVRFRRLLCGKPVILIDNGTLLRENLRRTRVTLDELAGHLREKNVLDIRTVQFAILETNGNLSVFPYPGDAPATAREAGIHPKKQSLPITIIEDGFLSRENLQKAGKDQTWLRTVLEAQSAEISDTFLLTVDDQDHIYFLGKDGRP